MAAAKQKKKREPTWQEKLSDREPLNRMDEIKADADFNHKFRVREQEERAKFEQLKAGGYQQEEASDGFDDADDDDSNGEDN